MEEKNSSGSWMRYLSLSTQWMVMLAIATWGGHKIDEKTNWKVPVFVILFPLVSLIVSLWQLVKEVSKEDKK